MKTLKRLFLRAILCKVEEEAELACAHLETEKDFRQWAERYKRFLFVYREHPTL